jgi:hypothetical protein
MPDAADHLALARSIVSGYADVVTAYISGSLVEGYGTPTSDLDVFLITGGSTSAVAASAASFDLSDHSIAIDFADTISTDTEVWPLATVREMSAVLVYDGGEWADALSVDDAWLTFAHRLRVGVPVQNEAVFRSLHGEFDWPSVALLLRDKNLAVYNNLADDAAGAIATGDPMTSLLVSRDALGTAMDAYLASRGATNPKAKWRWRKLLQLDEPELARRYREAETPVHADDDGILKSCRKRLRFANELAQRASQQAPSAMGSP